MPPGSLPAVGSVSPKQPISSPLAMPGQPLLLLLLRAVLVDGAHRQRPLHRDEGPQAGVAGLQFQGGQAVLDGAAAGAAVALQVHPEQAEIAELGGDLPREVRVLVPAGDVRADPRIDEGADLVPLRQFLGGEQRVQVQVVAGPVADRGGRRGDGPGVDADGAGGVVDIDGLGGVSWSAPGCQGVGSGGFEQDGDALADADAHGGQGAAGAAVVQFDARRTGRSGRRWHPAGARARWRRRWG